MPNAKEKRNMALYMKIVEETGWDNKREKGVTDLDQWRKNQKEEREQVRMDKRRGRSWRKRKSEDDWRSEKVREKERVWKSKRE